MLPLEVVYATAGEVFGMVSIVLGGMFLLAGYIAWPMHWHSELEYGYGAKHRGRKQILRFLWLTPIYFIPFLYIMVVEKAPKLGGKLGKAFREAWLDEDKAKKKAALRAAKEAAAKQAAERDAEKAKLDETKYERSEETNFKATPRKDTDYGHGGRIG